MVGVCFQFPMLFRVIFEYDFSDVIEKREEQLRRTTRDLRTRVAKCTEVDGGIFQRLL